MLRFRPLREISARAGSERRWVFINNDVRVGPFKIEALHSRIQEAFLRGAPRC